MEVMFYSNFSFSLHSLPLEVTICFDLVYPFKFLAYFFLGNMNVNGHAKNFIFINCVADIMEGVNYNESCLNIFSYLDTHDMIYRR